MGRKVAGFALLVVGLVVTMAHSGDAAVHRLSLRQLDAIHGGAEGDPNDRCATFCSCASECVEQNGRCENCTAPQGGNCDYPCCVQNSKTFCKEDTSQTGTCGEMRFGKVQPGPDKCKDGIGTVCKSTPPTACKSYFKLKANCDPCPSMPPPN